MEQFRKSITRKHTGAALFLLTGVLITLLIYKQGLGGSLHFDDKPNLDWLAQVNAGHTALNYILDGRAGLLGRPIALASFVHEAYAWPNFPSVFIQTNIYLHLINGLLIAWLTTLLARRIGRGHEQAAMTAAICSITWMLLPLLASSSLFIIQRMTLLSATFTLFGIISYLHFRSQIEQKPMPALTGMSLSIMIFGLLAAFSKENGALLPLYILVMEATLLNKPRIAKRATWNAWHFAFLTLPAILVLSYLMMRFQYDEKVLFSRNFNGAERLLTEAHILWQYLYNTFLPSPSAFAPFHDGYPVHRDWLSLTGMLAVGGWILVAGAAFLARKKMPLFTFAVAWYLIGHSLESTIIPLELYFEHRNYLPILGPIFALAAAICTIPAQSRKFAYGLLLPYLALQASILYSVVSLWGNPSFAAEMWHRYQPSSMRAAQHLAQQLQMDDYHHAARRVLQSYLAEHPDTHGVRIQILHISCGINEYSGNSILVDELTSGLPTHRFQRGTFDAIAKLYEVIKLNPCADVDQDTIYNMLNQLAENPAYKAYGLEYHNLQVLMARIGIDKRDLNLTMHHLEQALSSYHNIPTLTFVVNILISAGLHEAALSFVEEARDRRPSNALKALTWENNLVQMKTAIFEHQHQ